MVKRERIWYILLVSFFLIAFFHSFVHIAVYGTGVFGLAEKGVSGFSIGKVDVGEELSAKYGVESVFSRYLVIFEWVVFLAIAVFLYSINRIRDQRDLGELKTAKEATNSKIRTDIDSFYEMLKEKKRLKFSVVASVFDVSLSVVETWAKTLESAELATVDYPRFGSPEVLIAENKSERLIISNKKESGTEKIKKELDDGKKGKAGKKSKKEVDDEKEKGQKEKQTQK